MSYLLSKEKNKNSKLLELTSEIILNKNYILEEF